MPFNKRLFLRFYRMGYYSPWLLARIVYLQMTISLRHRKPKTQHQDKVSKFLTLILSKMVKNCLVFLKKLLVILNSLQIFRVESQISCFVPKLSCHFSVISFQCNSLFLQSFSELSLTTEKKRKVIKEKRVIVN